MHAEKALADVIQKVDRRFYGKYRGFVVKNDDPDYLGRLTLRVPSVLGKDVVTGWAMPCLPYGGAADQGLFFIPEPNAGVWVEFEEGDLEFPIWVGTFWSKPKPGGRTEIPKPADNQKPPTSKIIRTLKHTIELADKGGDEAIKITDATNSNVIVVDKEGIKIKAKKDLVLEADGDIKMKAANVKVTVSGSMDVG